MIKVRNLFLAVLACAAPLLSAAEKATVFHLGRPAQFDVIIELRAAPLVESQNLRLASASVDALQDRLAKDLARIEGEVPGRIAAQAAGSGAVRHTYRMAFAGASATISGDSLAAIRALPYVKAVHEDGKVEATLSKSVPHIGAPQVWQQYGVRGKGVTVAIIDTGIDYQH